MDKSGQNVPVARSEGHRFPEMNEAGLLVVAKRGETAAFQPTVPRLRGQDFTHGPPDNSEP